MKRLAAILTLFCLAGHAQKGTDGITSPAHQKYLNKIVFASDPDPSLLIKREIEANFKTDFNWGADDAIFFRVYMANSIYNYVKPLVKKQSEAVILENATFGFNYYIDNVLLDKLTGNIVNPEDFSAEDKKKLTTFKGALKTQNMSYFVGKDQFKEVINMYSDKLNAGKHQLKIEMFPVFVNPDGKGNIKGEVIATGEITLDVKNGAIDPNDPQTCMPKTELKDDALIKSIAKAHSGGGGFKVNPDAVRILSNKWMIIRNPNSGVIERRSLYVVVGYKNTKDSKCYKKEYTVSQEYVGNKYTDQIDFKADVGIPSTEINCKCLILK